jgi:hypothetical protein
MRSAASSGKSISGTRCGSHRSAVRLIAAFPRHFVIFFAGLVAGVVAVLVLIMLITVASVDADHDGAASPAFDQHRLHGVFEREELRRSDLATFPDLSAVLPRRDAPFIVPILGAADRGQCEQRYQSGSAKGLVQLNVTSHALIVPDQGEY